MRIIKSDYEKRCDRMIGNIRRNVDKLARDFNLRPFVDKDREDMLGGTVDNVYVQMVSSRGRIIERKYLFSASKQCP